MNETIRRDRSIKSLNREKLGEEALFAFDEAKRSLVVCASSKVSMTSTEKCYPPLTVVDQLQLHLFVFDESFRTLQAQGNTINLAPWYTQAETTILHAAFVYGNEEIVLVDSTAQARIFSFVTLQFRYDFPHSHIISPPTIY